MDKFDMYDRIEAQAGTSVPHRNPHLTRDPSLGETYTPFVTNSPDGRQGPEVEVHILITDSMLGTYSLIGACNGYVGKHLSAGGYWGIRWFFHPQPALFSRSQEVSMLAENLSDLEDHISRENLPWRWELA